MESVNTGDHLVLLFQCEVCYKCFERKDTLKRHMQIHSKPQRRIQSRKRACENCTRSKIRCGGEKPSCASCTRRNIECVYHNSPTPPVEHLEAFALQTPNERQNNIWNDVYDANDNWAFNENTYDLNLNWIFSTGIDTSSDYENEALFSLLPTKVQRPSVGEISRERQLLHDSPALSLPIPQTVERTGVDETVGHAAPLPTFSLPELPVEEQLAASLRFYPIKPIATSTRELMQDWLRLPLEQNIWDNISLSAFPPKETLDRCIDLYFAYWDCHCPILHRPTFDPAREPVVSLAMVTLGSCYTSIESVDFSNALSELVRRLLVFMAEKDPRFVRTEYYISAQLLQSAHALACGDRRLFELAESNRVLLVNHGRRMGLFQHYESTCPDNASVEQAWKAWIKDERKRLLGWGIYGFDATAGYILNVKPQLALADADMDLQLSSRHWEAPTAEAWASLHPWTQTPKNSHFRPLLRNLFHQPRTIPSTLQDQHHALPVILTIMRILWTFTELDTGATSDLFPRQQRNDQNRGLLLNMLDQFVVSPSSGLGLGTSKADMEVVHRVQTVHMAHIVSGGAFTDWLYPILRGGSEYTSAEQKMRIWAAKDPVRVRDQTFRCSQVLGLIREYPFNIPQEAFNVYHAGTLLWCLSSILAERIPRQPQQDAALCQLDLLDNHKGKVSAEIEDWINFGHPYRLALQGVPDLLCGVGRLQLLHQTTETLGGMHVWSISHNFTRVLAKLVQKESQAQGIQASKR